MPFLRITITGTELASEKQEALAKGFTELLDNDLQKDPQVAAVQIAVVPELRWYVNAQQHPSAISAHVEVIVTEGTNSVDQKARFLKNAYNLLERSFSMLSPVVYIVIQEIPAESWGYNGISQQARHSKQN